MQSSLLIKYRYVTTISRCMYTLICNHRFWLRIDMYILLAHTKMQKSICTCRYAIITYEDISICTFRYCQYLYIYTYVCIYMITYRYVIIILIRTYRCAIIAYEDISICTFRYCQHSYYIYICMYIYDYISICNHHIDMYISTCNHRLWLYIVVHISILSAARYTCNHNIQIYIPICNHHLWIYIDIYISISSATLCICINRQHSAYESQVRTVNMYALIPLMDR